MPSFHNGTCAPDHCPSRPHLFGRRMVVIKQMRWAEGHVWESLSIVLWHEDKNARPEARGMAQTWSDTESDSPHGRIDTVD